MTWLFLLACHPAEKSLHEPVEDEYQPAELEGIEQPADWQVPLDMPYLMAFHSCNVVQDNCGNPLNHQVHVAGAEQLDRWFLLDEIASFAGSVPDLLLRDGILYLYSLPELRRLDLRTGEWLATIYLEILDEDGLPMMYVDPSVTLDQQGRISLFFMLGAVGQDPATCGPEESSCRKEFYSATEEVGSLGSEFTLDTGIRMSIDISAGEIAADSDIFAGPDGFYQYVSRGQTVQVFFSTELRGSYTPVAAFSDGMLTAQAAGGIPAGDYDAQTQQFHVFVASQQGGSSVIRMASHNMMEQLLDDDFQTIIAGEDYFSEQHLVSSPGFWRNGAMQ